MNRRLWLIWLLWLALLVGSVLQISRTAIVTDVSSFLPGPANADQRLIEAQLRDGLSTRIMLIGLRLSTSADRDSVASNAKPTVAQNNALIAASRALREKLAVDPAFAWVVNGDMEAHALDRDRLFAARYLLSPAVSTQLFSKSGLADAFARLEQELVSVRGTAIKAIASADPTLEAIRILDRASEKLAPLASDGVWLSSDGRSAILLLETAAKGDDIARLRSTIQSARDNATQVLASWPKMVLKNEATSVATSEPPPTIEFAGSGYFNVMSHDAIGKDAERLSLFAIALVAALLLWSLRRPRLLGLAVIPVATGTLAGFAAVGLANGSIHGITIAFGVTLIGEAVDYAIYTFVQRDDAGRHDPHFWRQLSLATLTSLIGFAAMYFSGFQGLQQLGLFSMVGLIVAAVSTAWLLPSVLPSGNRNIRWEYFTWLPALSQHLRKLRWALLAVTVVMLVVLLQRHDRMWRDSLDSLSSSSPAEVARDQRYRDDIGVPDLRTMVAVRGSTIDEALSRTESATKLLDELVQAGSLQGYDSPSTLLPSRAVQLRRQAVLPTADVLRPMLQEALADGNLNAKAFEPFIADIANARTMAPLDLAYYDKTVIGSWLKAQIVNSADGVSVLILLHGVKPGLAVDQRLAHANLAGVSLIDLKRDVELLVADYRQQGMRTALIGAALIFLVLVVQLRRAPAVLSMVATLVSTVIITAGLLLLFIGHLTVFNLVALLLVVGVASNYTLFFSTLPADPQKRQRASLSVLLAASSTFIGFAMLASSSTPILATIGLTVSIGAAIGLLASMVFSPEPVVPAV